MCWFVLDGLVSGSRCSLCVVICLLRIYVLSSLYGLMCGYTPPGGTIWLMGQSSCLWWWLRVEVVPN
jgi:hypothetical protein